MTTFYQLKILKLQMKSFQILKLFYPTKIMNMKQIQKAYKKLKKVAKDENYFESIRNDFDLLVNKLDDAKKMMI